ncbi:MAG: hypothetical protein MZU91_03275 [Desulfosudis oleivorans]|nr:hypothetical protein [Desulfosudis oleivorans]
MEDQDRESMFVGSGISREEPWSDDRFSVSIAKEYTSEFTDRPVWHL